MKVYGDEGVLEGGYTGEFGFIQPRYFEGVANLMEKEDPNPVRYLWATQWDGCFQKGSGDLFRHLQLALSSLQSNTVLFVAIFFQIATSITLMRLRVINARPLLRL